MRLDNRGLDELRPIKFTRQFTRYAEGSVLVEFGNTKVLCNASILAGQVPRFLKGKNQGWITAEYGMLPRATHDRSDREAARGRQSGRTQEIQRLIGRSLRSCIDLTAIGENTITIDCDVLQADGGTRTAAITGGCLALYDAVQQLESLGVLTKQAFVQFISAVSVGIHQGKVMLDLDYSEDSSAATDMNMVLNDKSEFIEIQGTAEDGPFNLEQLHAMTELARKGANELLEMQKEIIKT